MYQQRNKQTQKTKIMKNFKLITTNQTNGNGIELIALTINGVQQNNLGCMASSKKGFKSATVLINHNGSIRCKFSKSDTPNHKLSKKEETVLKIVGIATFETNENENKSKTIIEKFNDRGIEAIASLYAKRDNLTIEEKKTVTDILEVLAFNDEGVDSERAMELINKY